MYDSLLAEEAVAASILVSPQTVLPTIRGIVQPGDFIEDNARAVYRAAVELDDNRLPVDPVTIQERAAEMGSPVSSEWIRETMASCPTAANIAVNAEIVHKAAIDREARNVGEELTEGKLTPEEALERLQDTLTGRRSTLPTPAEDATAFYTMVCQAAEGELRTSLPTGFPELDDVLGGGLAASGLTTIAARPSVGKTTLGLAIASNVARDGGRVLYISLEMTRNQLWARRLASRTGISATSILNGNIRDDGAWKMIGKGVSELSQEPLIIWDKPCRIGDIELKARAAAPLNLLVVDYMTNITDEKGEAANPYVSASNKCRRLQALASAIEVPVLMLSQLNRAADARDNKRPRLSDLRDTGKIEECSDAVLLLYRDSYYQDNKPQPWEHQTLEVEVAKNRHGQTGRVCLDYVPMTASVLSGGFRDVSEVTPFG